MFDKLVVSEPDRADFKDRRKYFMVSSFVVGILFVTAVVFSIFAADYGIGSGSFELTEMIAPVDMAAVAPEPLIRQSNQSQSRDSNVPMRSDAISRTDEPTIVPTTTSSIPNTGISRPLDGRFVRGPINTDSVGGDPNGTGRNISGDTGMNGGGLTNEQPSASNRETDTPPPPVVIKPKGPVSIGVVNGKATSLPKPPYPTTAIALRLEGKVDVQVTIDENGNVISAKAVSGHPFFRSPAEQAARNARFTPTLLSRVPVKVTGVIVYNFTRN